MRTDPETYQAFADNLETVGKSIIEIDRDIVEPTAVHLYLRPDFRMTGGDRSGVPDLEEVRQTMEALERLDAITEHRSYAFPAYVTERYDEGLHSTLTDLDSEIQESGARLEEEINRPVETTQARTSVLDDFTY